MDIVDLHLDQPQTYDAPGGTSDRAASGVDLSSNDPLVHLGLVDAQGQALPTDEWTPPSAQPQVQAQPQASSTQVAPVQQGPSPAQGFQVTAATLQAQAAQAYSEATARGIDPNVAAQIIGARLEAELTKAQSAADRQVADPIVRRQAATVIAQKHGAGQVRPEELVAYDSPQSMIQAATQLAASRRATGFQSRAVAGTDRTEGGAPARGLAPAIAGLSSTKKIELGIRRGQYS